MKVLVVLVLCILSKKSHQDVTDSTQEVEIIPSTDDGELSSEYSHQVTVSYGCPVNPIKPCVSKCCDLNKAHVNLALDNSSPPCAEKTLDFWVKFDDRPDYKNVSLAMEERYEYFIGDPCVTGKYILEPHLYATDKHTLYSNGSIFVDGKFYSMSDYCVDDVDGEIRAFICFETNSVNGFEFYHILYPVGQLLSIPFLLATAAMYICIEQFRDLQGKTLVCYVSCLTIAFFFLALVQLSGPQFDHAFCTAAAFIIQFSFVGCFFWLNVLCYDSYRNFRLANQANRNQSMSERKLFIMYSIYAWNGPMILFVVSLVIDMVPGLPDQTLRPEFGSQSCWFSSETAALPYFFGPVGVLLGINVVFFILTAYTYCHIENNRFRGENEISKKNKYRLYIKNTKQCFKIFMTMGLCWLAEIISWAIGGSRYIWITTDVINTLQGILIFYFYVWEPKSVRNKLKEHLIRFKSILCPCQRCREPPQQPALPSLREQIPLHTTSV